MRRLAITLLCLALLASSCGADAEIVDLVDGADVAEAVDPTEQDFDDDEFAADEDPVDDDEDDEFDDSELDGPEPDDLDEDLDDPASVCPQNPDAAGCDEWFEGLSDREYCEVQPDDPFCDETQEGEPDEDEPAEEEADEPELSIVTGPDSIAVAGINPAATRDDGQCLPDEDAGSDQGGVEFNLAYQVVDGELGAACFGSPNGTVEDAWRILADLVPPGQLRDLAVFAGFSSTEDADGVTLAFVQALDDDATQFLMAVNIAETENDRDEATLTMAHEFTHVFTALPTEIDRTIEPSDCTTFDNGEGCYRPESILNQWYDTFWQNAPGDPTDESGADERCDLDAGYFGNYAASNPEEDFAESFSAYVLRVEAKTPGQQARLDWIDGFAGLREFRDRAVALGYGPQAHNFDACG